MACIAIINLSSLWILHTAPSSTLILLCYCQVFLTLQSFSGPADVSTSDLATLYASDVSAIEQIASPKLSFFVPPPWVAAVLNGSSSDELLLQQSLPTLMAAANSLYTEGVTSLKMRPLLLYYRRDVLAHLGQPVPETWQQLLGLAALINGTDLNGDGVRDHALCCDVDPGE